MSRHRNVRKLNIQEELEEDDVEEYWKEEESPPPSPETSQFFYRRKGNEATAESVSPAPHRGNAFPSVGMNRNVAGRAELPSCDVPPGFEQYPRAASTDVEEKPKAAAKPVPRLLEEPRRPNGGKKEPNQKPIAEPSAKPLPNITSTQRAVGSPLEQALATAPSPRPVARSRDAQSKHSTIVNLVVAGHVDSGKSTIMGHLLYLLREGLDERSFERCKQEASRASKSSFAYAWILDDAQEERNRGITMDVARATFTSSSTKRRYNILDAPGHRDFIPNMISGAAQADVALLVINSTVGEFETGLDQGGQTREHSLLLRALGVSKLVVAVNKLDTVDWKQERYSEVVDRLRQYLEKQVGFDDITFVPVSGLLGINMVSSPEKQHALAQWYSGPSLIEALDRIPCTKDKDEKPLRFLVHDIVRMTSTVLQVSGKVEAGSVQVGDKLFAMPDAIPVEVERVANLEDISNASPSRTPARQSREPRFSGEQIDLSCKGNFEPVNSIHVLCRGGSELVIPAEKFIATIVVFDGGVPILAGTRVELLTQSLRFSCCISKLLETMGKEARRNPRVITKGATARVEIACDEKICIEPSEKCRATSRFILRLNNETIAAGVVDKIVK